METPLSAVLKCLFFILLSLLGLRVFGDVGKVGPRRGGGLAAVCAVHLALPTGPWDLGSQDEGDSWAL